MFMWIILARDQSGETCLVARAAVSSCKQQEPNFRHCINEDARSRSDFLQAVNIYEVQLKGQAHCRLMYVSAEALAAYIIRAI
jgi:hypothetical protein